MTEGITNDLTKEEYEEVLNDLLESDIAKNKREKLSESSFREWVYQILRSLFAKLGYTIASFEEFWVDVGLSITRGWKDGVEKAHREAEIKRKIREKKYS